jgi:hypothetical protein
MARHLILLFGIVSVLTGCFDPIVFLPCEKPSPPWEHPDAGCVPEDGGVPAGQTCAWVRGAHCTPSCECSE